MASLLPLFFDVVNKRLVISAVNPDPFTVPTLFQEDSYTIEFVALLPTGNQYQPIYSRLNLAGYDLTISVGTAGVINAQATVWTPNAENTALTGTLAMNTAGINALANGSIQIFEIRLFDGTNYTRGQQNVAVNKSVAVTGALVPAVNDTALGTNAAKRIYVRKEGAPGEQIILKSEDGLRQGVLYWDNDNSFRAEPLS